MSFSNKKDASNLTRGENQDNIAAMMKEAEDAAKEGATRRRLRLRLWLLRCRSASASPAALTRLLRSVPAGKEGRARAREIWKKIMDGKIVQPPLPLRLLGSLKKLHMQASRRAASRRPRSTSTWTICRRRTSSASQARTSL